MIVISDNGNSSYFLEKATAIKLEDNTKELQERHPISQGGLYTIKLYYNPGNLNLYTTLARYQDYDVAWAGYVGLLSAAAEGRPVYDFSGQIFHMYEEPDAEEERDLQEEEREE